MKIDMASPFHTLFIPHPHNNHKAKVLWSQSLFILLGLYLIGRSIIDITIGLKPNVLGYASQISVEKVIELTNSRRLNANVEIVKENAQLSAAANAKLDDMFKNNYWAHVSPTGTEPWYFVTNAGYKYQHAGENLARDFSNANDVVSAWMASPTHKKNLLDSRYKDIGVAVKDGYINGVETTIVVQMFGATPNAANVRKISATDIDIPEALANEVSNEPIVEVPVISPLKLSKVWSMSFVLLILFALSLDWVFVLRYNLIRLSGKTWAHLTYILFVAIAILVIEQGIII